ncbi:unnamed protein product [Rhizoctonia solani]|uniref:Ricin B lectin domain-containing protein n=1 Tax=Rhizoctonia solani TaxID=456999 RepID=A0A8H3HNT0_9AGAM|nr:unnamed protein product [Rhizoctonia solani]
MGQAQASSVWDSYTLNSDIAPGTYRIIHEGTNKVLQIHEQDPYVIVLQQQRQEDDYWFVLPSGDGFIFKHGREKTYLTAPWSSSLGPQLARATRYPTTWTIHNKKDSDDLRCVIMVGMDRNEVWSGGEYLGLVGEISQRGVCFARLSETEEHDQLWRLERIGDDTVEEDSAYRIRELERQLESANARWTAGESTLKAMLHQLDAKELKLETIQRELGKQTVELDAVREELGQQAAELRHKFNALDEIRELLDARERAMFEKDRTLFGDEVVDEKARGESLEARDRFDDTISIATGQQSEPERASTSETQIQSIESSAVHVAAPVEQRLAELGWSFD